MTDYGVSLSDVFATAAERVGIDGWKGYRWQKIDNGHLVTGCVPSGVYASGPRKGDPRFNKPVPGTLRLIAITTEEMRARAERFEATTGQCWNCKGTGQEWAGWSAAEGSRTRTCSRCGGTGNAPAGVTVSPVDNDNPGETT